MNKNCRACRLSTVGGTVSSTQARCLNCSERESVSYLHDGYCGLCAAAAGHWGDGTPNAKALNEARWQRQDIRRDMMSRGWRDVPCPWCGESNFGAAGEIAFCPPCWTEFMAHPAHSELLRDRAALVAKPPVRERLVAPCVS